MKMDNITAKRLMVEDFEQFKNVDDFLSEFQSKMEFFGVKTIMDSTTGEVIDITEIRRVRGILGFFEEPVKIIEIIE